MLQIPQEMMRSRQRFDVSGRPLTQDVTNEIELSKGTDTLKAGYSFRRLWPSLLLCRLWRQERAVKPRVCSVPSA